MAVTKVQICNMALTHIGIKQLISAITDDNEEAAMCNLHYDSALETALHEADWGFARRRYTLVAEAGTPPDPWSYQYQWPTNCIRVLRIDDELLRRRVESRPQYRFETNGSGARIIYTNWADAVVIYTYNETDDQIYTPAFSYYLSWVLAARIAGPLTSSEKLADRTEKRAMMELERAVAKDYEREEEGPELEASWIDARHGDVGLIPGVSADDYWAS